MSLWPWQGASLLSSWRLHNAAKKSQRSTHTQKPGRRLELWWLHHKGPIIQHSFPWLSHTLCCMAREKRQAKLFEQRITSLSDSCFCDYTCTVHDSTHYQCSTDLHRHSLLKLSSSSSSTSPSTLQSSEFASFKWAVTIQPQRLSLFMFVVLLPADGFDWSWTIPIFSLSPYSLATSTRSSSLFEKSDMPATSLIMCHTRWHTDYHLCEFFSSHSYIFIFLLIIARPRINQGRKSILKCGRDTTWFNFCKTWLFWKLRKKMVAFRVPPPPPNPSIVRQAPYSVWTEIMMRF